MEFLSPEWFAALRARLALAPASPGTARLSIGQVVTGGPSGEVAYTISLGGDAPGEVEVGSTTDATVTLVEDYETAHAIAAGAAVSAMLSEGRIKVRGDANALVASYETLAGLSAALAAPGG